jgi:starvation-inducible DNA-binding protein
LIAERIRALGDFAPGSYTSFRELSSVKEAVGVPKATDMVRDLVESHETVARTSRTVFESAEKGNDEASLDLLTQRIQLHEKTAWMLRSLLQ